MTIEDLLKEIAVENPTIKVGRDKVWPLREGLQPPKGAVEAITTALHKPEALKGTVSISDGKETVYKVKNGEIVTPWPSKTAEQTHLFDAIPQPSESVVANEETVKITDQVFSGFKEFSMSASELTEKENTAAQEMYGKLLSMNPKTVRQTIESLASSSIPAQQAADKWMAAAAVEHKITRTQFDRILGEGSPYVKGANKAMAMTSNEAHINEALRDTTIAYQQEMSQAYASQQRIAETSSKIQAAFAYQDSLSPEDRQKYTALSNVQGLVSDALEFRGETFAPIKDNPTLEELQENIAINGQSAKERGLDLLEVVPGLNQQTAKDHGIESLVADTNAGNPVDAMKADEPTPEPLANKAIAAIKDKINMFQAAQKNLATFGTTVKDKGLKGWAAEQVPIVQQAAIEMVQQKGEEVKDWAIAKYPDLKKVAVSAGTALKNKVVSDIKITAKAIDLKIKELPEERIALIQNSAKDVIGLMNPGGNTYSTNKFDMRLGQDGNVSIHLRDFEGTPVLQNGRLNYEAVGLADINSLDKLPDVTNRIKCDIAQAKTAKSYQREMLEV
jgi:hypothetical protein